MTELTTWTIPQPTYVPDYQTRAVQRLSEWVQSADAAYAVAERLVQSSFVPAAFRGKPIEATAAILAGSEVGLSPMAALRAFDIIQGQAAPRAITLRAIVQSFGHEVEIQESTATRCIMRGRRRGSQNWQASTWTMDRAISLGLAGKDGWKKQPIAMLQARATSEICRLVAADAILGIGYTTEELSDGATGDPIAYEPTETPPAPEQPTTRRMSRRPQGDAGSGAASPPNPRGRMFALLAERGITDPQEQRNGMSSILGREVTSRATLTPDEMHRISEHLVANVPVQPALTGDLDE